MNIRTDDLRIREIVVHHAWAHGRMEDGGLVVDADLDHQNYYIAHETIVRRDAGSSMAPMSFAIFSFLNRIASRAPDFFKIPQDAIIEVGFRVEI